MRTTAENSWKLMRITENYRELMRTVDNWFGNLDYCLNKVFFKSKSQDLSRIETQLLEFAERSKEEQEGIWEICRGAPLRMNQKWSPLWKRS